jgi:hypothetical protein
MHLFLRSARSFAQVQKRTWSEAQPIFKDYYSRRLTLTPSELQHFLLKLTAKQFSEEDHRWLSLLQNIEAHLPKYALPSKVYMLKALIGMDSKAELNQKLTQSIMAEVKGLSFEESALMLWNLSKLGGQNKLADATSIYEHLCKILAEHEEEGAVRIVIRRTEK